MLKVVIIGTGQIGRIHANSIKKSSNIELLGFIGRDIEKTKNITEEYGVQKFNDIDILDNEKVDIAIVCTPSYIRKEIIYKLIDKGINILCEKPFTLSYKEGLDIFNYAKDRNIKIMVAHVIRFWPAFREIKGIIDKGDLGEIIHIYINRLSKHPDWTSWHKDPEKSGGGLYDLAIHDLDYLVYLFGKVDSVDSIGRRNKNGCYNITTSNLRFNNFKQATVESNMELKGDYPFTTFVRVVGEKGTLEYESSQKLSKKGIIKPYEYFVKYIENEKPKHIEIPRYDPYLKQIEYFGKSIKEDKEIEIITMEEVLHVLKLLESIKTSIEENRRVRISEE